jgi:hypothetical protein
MNGLLRFYIGLLDLLHLLTLYKMEADDIVLEILNTISASQSGFKANCARGLTVNCDLPRAAAPETSQL